MKSRRSKIRMNVECDRLSNLPDELIHKILSYVSIKQAIETSVWSSRWRYIWTSMPYLNFSSGDFHRKFVTNALSGRNNQIDVSSINLTFDENVREVYVKTILDYAFSHNAKQLHFTCLPGKKIKYPLYAFSSQSLKNLTLTRCTYGLTCELPTLTTLYLHHVTFCYDNTDTRDSLFSNCTNLKNLTLNECRTPAFFDFSICHPGLTSLTLEDSIGRVNVVTPQLMNLTIKRWRRIHLISAPNLSSLHYIDDYRYGSDLLLLSTDLLHLEKVNICAHCPLPFEDKAYTQKIVCLLQQLHSVKFLTLNLEIVKLISSSVELISHQPSPFTNLKTLKIYPAYSTGPFVMSTEVINYLLDGSPRVIFTMVSREEIRAVLNVVSARNLMRCLQTQLDELKENSETKTVKMKKDKATLHEQEEIVNKSRYINTVLRFIERVLAELPTSHLDKLQARFSGLCAEAETVLDSMMDQVKTQCNKKPRRSNRK